MGRIGTPLGVPLSRQVDNNILLSAMWYQALTTDGVTSASSIRSSVTATANAAANTVGAYTEIVSALAQDISGIFVQVTTATNVATTDSSTLINIAIGGAGAEVVIIPNLGVGYKITTNTTGMFIPVSIPLGTRVAFNAQSAIGGKTVGCRFTFITSRRKIRAVPTQIDTYGANTATSEGIAVTNPAGTNAKGAWTEITSGTTRPLQGLFISVQGAQSTAISSGNVLIDVAIGSAGNEIIISPDMYALTNASEAVDLILPSTIIRHIPAGTRISARYARSVAATIDVIVHGIPY